MSIFQELVIVGFCDSLPFLTLPWLLMSLVVSLIVPLCLTYLHMNLQEQRLFWVLVFVVVFV
jgi:hypothetical protein